jgi:hypothetical protein
MIAFRKRLTQKGKRVSVSVFVFGPAALALEHYVFSFRRFTLYAAKQCGANGPFEEGQVQTLMSPAWTGFLACFGTVCQLVSVGLFWHFEGWLVAVCYAAVAFLLFGALFPLFPFLGHYRWIAKNVLSSRFSGHQGDASFIRDVLDHIEDFS